MPVSVGFSAAVRSSVGHSASGRPSPDHPCWDDQVAPLPSTPVTREWGSGKSASQNVAARASSAP
jgi:hypothetical protein